jgi:hypothetical protein
MATESVLIAASYERPADAEAAVKDLGTAGFTSADISLLYTDKGHVAKEGLIQGAAFGGFVGGLVGLLFPPAGIIVAAGPILGTLASGLGSAAGTAAIGGAMYALTDTLVQMGMPKEMADSFGGHVHKGDTLLIIHTTTNDAGRARQILDAHHARATEGGPENSGAVTVTPAKTAV